MKTIGIIAEFNPFHKGHEAFLQKAKESSGADFCVVIMSGDFVQRGLPSLLPKELRAQSALIHGADLVLELPPRFATSSAEGFAFGSIAALQDTGVVSEVVFGSEQMDENSFHIYANLLREEPFSYRQKLQEELKNGISFPKARERALQFALQSEGKKIDPSFDLSLPNTLLGIEYIRAAFTLHTSFCVKPIPRTGAGHDSDQKNGAFSSASALRAQIQEHHSIKDFFAGIPDEDHMSLTTSFEKSWPLLSSDLNLLLQAKLLQLSKESLLTYADVDEALADRILNLQNEFTDWEAFCHLIKTKAYSYSRISRVLTHLLLNITKDDVPTAKNAQHEPNLFSSGYLRVLGMREEASSLLKDIHQNGAVPLIQKHADFVKCDKMIQQRIERDLFPTHLYEAVLAQKYRQTFRHEWTKPPVIIRES